MQPREPQASTTSFQKQVFIKDLTARSQVRSTFLVKSKELSIAKNAKPYLNMVLADCTGDVDTRIWEEAEQVSELFKEGDIVAINGKTHQFQNRLQLVVQHITPIPSSEVNLDDYLPRAAQNLEALYAELLAVFENMKNSSLRDLGLALLRDPEIAERYKVCPAAKTIHHAFIGGLLSHSLQLIKIIDSIVPLYEKLDRDLLVFGAAFHDFGKIFELSYERGFGYTDEGKLVGHIAIGTCLIDRKIQSLPNFPRALEWQVKHLVLAHHGRLEYGSPKKPATLEAVILSTLDDLDSKIQSIQTLMNTENGGASWTAYHKAYDQYYFKPNDSSSLP